MSELERYDARMKAKGLISASKWPTTDDEAREFNRIEDWLEVPVNNLTSRLAGEIFLIRDGAAERVNVKTGERTPANKSRLHLAEFLEQVSAFMIEQSAELATLRAERDAAVAGLEALRAAVLAWANDGDPTTEQALLDLCDLDSDGGGVFYPRATLASIRGR